MSALTYIKKIEKELQLNGREKHSITNSIKILKKKLDKDIGNDVENCLVFGSLTRKTILPRKFDPKSDVDFMVVFRNKDTKPDSHLERLRRFADRNYKRNEVKRSHPTIVIELNHIFFELVPAIAWGSKYRIPARVKEPKNWIETDPCDVLENLTQRNKKIGNMRQVIRLAKLWNAVNNHPFESFQLERTITAYGFYKNYNLLERFTQFMKNGLPNSRGLAKWKKEVLVEAQHNAGRLWANLDKANKLDEEYINRIFKRKSS